MRNPERIQRVLQLVHEYWQRNPDIRLGQLIANFAHGMMNDHKAIDTYQIEDDVIEQRLIEFLCWADRLDSEVAGNPVPICPRCASPTTRRRQDKLDEPPDEEPGALGRIKDCIECYHCPDVYVLLPGGWFSVGAVDVPKMGR